GGDGNTACRTGKGKCRCRAVGRNVGTVAKDKIGNGPVYIGEPLDLPDRMIRMDKIERVSRLYKPDGGELRGCVGRRQFDRRTIHDLPVILHETNIEVPELQNICLLDIELETDNPGESGTVLDFDNEACTGTPINRPLHHRDKVQAGLEANAVFVDLRSAIQKRREYPAVEIRLQD